MAWLAAVVIAGALAVAGCDEDDLGGRTDGRDYLRPGDTVRVDSTDRGLGGAVVVEDEDGRLAVVFALDRSVFHPDSNRIVLDSLGRAGPYPGTLKDFECLLTPDDRLDPSAYDAEPEPEVPGDYTREFLDALRRYWLRRYAAQRHYVLVTEEVADGDTTSVVRIFDGVGTLLGEHRVAGSFEKALPNPLAGDKTILTTRAGRLRYALFDVVTGEKRGESGPGTDFDAGTDIVDVEVFGNRLIILERDRGATQVRMRILGLDGVEFFVILIPGEFVRAVHNGTRLKFIATRDTTRTPPNIYTDLVDIFGGQRLSNPGPTGFASNPAAGDSVHIQHDTVRVADQRLDRFVSVVRNTANNDTEVRVVDAAGRTVGTLVLSGRPATRPGAIRPLGRCKLIVQEVNGNTEATLIDLVSGNRISLTPLAGAFVRTVGNVPGPIRVQTRRETKPVSLAGC